MEQSHDVHLNHDISAATISDVEQCLNAFDRHLESERGCAPGTRAHYLGEARCFLVDVFPDRKTNWEGLNADHVAGFVLRRAETLSWNSSTASALRQCCDPAAVNPLVPRWT